MISLETGMRAVRTQQRALDVTSNNIANINTPGYTRQEALLSPTDPMVTPRGSFGTGVFSDNIRQYREHWLDEQMRNALSRQSASSYDNQIFQQMQTALNEPSDYGIDSALDKFYTSVEQLSSKPDDMSYRQNLLNSATNLAGTFNTIGTNLSNLRTQVYHSVEANVTSVNRLLQGIADMNTNIFSSRSADGSVASTYLDKQNVMIEELSKFGDIQLVHNDDGTTNVTMNGANVVSLNHASSLEVQQDINTSTGEVTATLAIKDEKGNIVGTFKPLSGELSSQLKAYNVLLDDKDSSGGFSLVKQLDTLANTIVDKVNSIAQNGYGLDDTGTTPPGRNFFVPAPSGGSITAKSIAVDTGILADPRSIPTASSSGTPGNSDVIRQIGQLVNDHSFIGNQTGREYYGLTLTKVANFGADSLSSKSISDASIAQLTNQREAATGVNLDEEAVNMIKFQRAFEAAARVINTTSELLKTVVNLGA